MLRSDVRRRLLSATVAVALAVPTSVAVSATAHAAGASPAGFATLATRTTTTATTTFDVLRRGDKGKRVSRVQLWLDISRTRYYGDRTVRQVRRFQAHRPMADTGRVDERTWNALRSRYERQLQRYARILTVARNQFGDPYVYGAAGPNAFDCSGFTLFVYERATGIALPHQSGQQYRTATKITRSQAHPGDLVFFHSGSSVYHTGIYAGRGYILHSPSSGRVVTRERIWTSNVWFGRVIGRA